MKYTKHKCECPETSYVPLCREHLYSKSEKSGMNHLPGECKGTNKVKQYYRDGKKLWLCSCCVLPGDREVGQ